MYEYNMEMKFAVVLLQITCIIYLIPAFYKFANYVALQIHVTIM